MHPAVRTLDVHNFDNTGRDPVQRDAAVGLKKHGAALLFQEINERIDIFLQQGLSTSYLHQGMRALSGTINEFVKSFFKPVFFVGVAGITIAASEVAACKPDKDARQAGKG